MSLNSGFAFLPLTLRQEMSFAFQHYVFTHQKIAKEIFLGDGPEGKEGLSSPFLGKPRSHQSLIA